MIVDTPGKPGSPVVEDVDEDSATLSWTKPDHDGGDKIKGYVVEQREKGTTTWKPLNDKNPCKGTRFTGNWNYGKPTLAVELRNLRESDRVSMLDDNILVKIM